MPASMIAFQDSLGRVLEEYEQLWRERSTLATENASLRAELEYISHEIARPSTHSGQALVKQIPRESESSEESTPELSLQEDPDDFVPEDVSPLQDHNTITISLVYDDRKLTPHKMTNHLNSLPFNEGTANGDEPLHKEKPSHQEHLSPTWSPPAARRTQTHMEAMQRARQSTAVQPRESASSLDHFSLDSHRSSQRKEARAKSMPALKSKRRTSGAIHAEDGAGNWQDAQSHDSYTLTRSSDFSDGSIYDSSSEYAAALGGVNGQLSQKSVRILDEVTTQEVVQGMDLVARAVVSLVAQGKTLSYCQLRLRQLANEYGAISRTDFANFLESAIRTQDDPYFKMSLETFDEEIWKRVAKCEDNTVHLDILCGLLQDEWRQEWTDKRMLVGHHHSRMRAGLNRASRTENHRTSRIEGLDMFTTVSIGSRGARRSSREASWQPAESDMPRSNSNRSHTEHVIEAKSLRSKRSSAHSRYSGRSDLHLTSWGSANSNRRANTSVSSRVTVASIREPVISQNDATWHAANQVGSDNTIQSAETRSGRLFPEWWDPPKEQLAGLGTNFKPLGSVCPVEEQRTCVVSPVSNMRLCWDLIAFILVLYEVWATPFELVYLSKEAVPDYMNSIAWAMVVFFSMDICLNFNTGFVMGYTIVRDQKRCAKHYLKFWFCLDLIATVPFDKITEQAGTSVVTHLRYMKLLKALKTVRYIRLNKVIDALKHSHNVFEVMGALGWLYRSFVVVLCAFMLTHVHSCIWAALQPEFTEATSMSEAMDKYLEIFQVTFVNLMTVNALGATTFGVRLLEMIIVTERLAGAVLIFSYGVFWAMMSFEEDAQRSVRKDDTLRYLRRHNVPVKTQLQVVFALKQAARAQGEQNNFEKFLDQDLPWELKRIIAEELWSMRLLSNGLIEAAAKWHVDFLPELALICREEVLASGATIFRQGDPCLGAYQVITGLVGIRNTRGDQIPSFRQGMWIGEKSLVNPRFRRSATGFTEALSYLMLVPSEGFQELLKDLDLHAVFETWCAAELWLGFCGRCGTIGDHFTDSCPLELEARPSPLRLKIPVLERLRMTITRRGRPGPKPRESKILRASVRRDNLLGAIASKIKGGNLHHLNSNFDPNLQKFMHFHGIEHLAPVFEALKVSTLEALEESDRAEFRAWIFEHMPDIVMTASDMAALSKKNISRFRSEVQVHIHRMLDKRSDEHPQHLIFLSHYKLEAGTEAALMRSELEAIIAEDKEHPANDFTTPVFLDSEDLQDLKDLKEQVQNSHNVGLLCTADVLRRPWCLAEIATAWKIGVNILPVQVDKRGNTFQFPDQVYYSQLLDGTLLSPEEQQILTECNVDIPELAEAIRSVFNRIAVTYSPHKAAGIRRAELQALLDQCELRQPDKNHGAVKSRGISTQKASGRSRSIRKRSSS